jgi:hypothetical protein
LSDGLMPTIGFAFEIDREIVSSTFLP